MYCLDSYQNKGQQHNTVHSECFNRVSSRLPKSVHFTTRTSLSKPDWYPLNKGLLFLGVYTIQLPKHICNEPALVIIT